MYSMLRDFALTIGAAFVDIWGSGKRSWKYWQSLGYWGTGNTDPVHPGDTGHQAYADMINGLLL
jgi:hypothetical protein